MNKNYLLERIEELEEEVDTGGGGGSTFPNESTLLKFSETTGELYWDGVQISGGGATLPIDIVDVSGLTLALSEKAEVGHTHPMSDVTGLDTALNGKANTQHTHNMSDVNGLASALSSKADVTELHSHANMAVLNGLGESSGALTYNGSPVGGGGGVTTFTALSDTPSTMVGNAGKMTVVNAAEDALELVDVPSGGGGGGGTAWTSFTFTVRRDPISSGDIQENQGYWRETGDGCVEFYGIFRWIGTGTDALILINFPFTSLIDYKGMSYLPVNMGSSGDRPPLPDDDWYAGFRDNGWLEIKGRNANYPKVGTNGSYRGFTLSGKYPKL